MDLLTYLNLKVYINLTNGFYYTGIVINADSESITLRDKNNKLVSLKKEVIQSITELSK